MIPKISNYGQHKSPNYGVHTLNINMGKIEFYYSYETIVAYWDKKDGLVCSKNVWTVTTGKHLNWIEPDKSRRIENKKFQKMLEEATKRHTI